MEINVPTVIAPEDWENILTFCQDPTLAESLYLDLESIVPEWMDLFTPLYEDEAVNVTSNCKVVTGMLRVNKEKDSWTYGCVATVIIRDPNRYYTMMTRFVSIYLDENLLAVSVSKSKIPPYIESGSMQSGIIKKS